MPTLCLSIGLIFVSFVLGTACLPQPESEVERAAPELLVKGRIRHSSDSVMGRVALYLAQSPLAETSTEEDGSFLFVLDAERLKLLRLQAGADQTNLDLYFQSEPKAAEAAIVSGLNLQARGEWNIGLVQMQRQRVVAGRVVAHSKSNTGPLPVEKARILLGREELFTDAQGLFQGSVPESLATPVVVEKQGFVQTQGTWSPATDETRDIALYSEPLPYGSIEAIPSIRSASPPLMTLNYSATSASRWIRFARSASDLTKTYEPGSPWLDLRQPLQLSQNDFAAVIHYQFADQNQAILSPVFSYSLSLNQ